MLDQPCTTYSLNPSSDLETTTKFNFGELTGRQQMWHGCKLAVKAAFVDSKPLRFLLAIVLLTYAALAKSTFLTTR